MEPVEEGASGAAALFDGNFTNDCYSWSYPTINWDDAKVPDMLDMLMEWTVAGHLAWVVFVPQGFRI